MTPIYIKTQRLQEVELWPHLSSPHFSPLPWAHVQYLENDGINERLWPFLCSCKHVCLCAYVYMCVSMCACACMWALCLCELACVSVCVCVSVSMYVHLCGACVPLCMCVHAMGVCLCVCVRMLWGRVCVWACDYVCVWEREREYFRDMPVSVHSSI